MHFCSGSFGGRPITVTEWRSTPSKESTTSVVKITKFFVSHWKLHSKLFLQPFPRQAGSSSRIEGECSRITSSAEDFTARFLV